MPDPNLKFSNMPEARAPLAEADRIGFRSSRPPRRRAVLQVASEQLAALLHLPADVSVAAFQLDHLRDAVALLLESDRFEPVQPGCEPPSLIAEVAVETGDDGAVTTRTLWPGLEGAEVAVRRDARHEPSWAAGVRWAAEEADAQASGREPVYILDITDHLRACADDPQRGSAVKREAAP